MLNRKEYEELLGLVSMQELSGVIGVNDCFRRSILEQKATDGQIERMCRKLKLDVDEIYP